MKGCPTKKTCPVAKLPAELLVEIFLYVVSPSVREEHSPPTLYAPHTPSYDSCASPFSISHVCRFWRVVSVSVPRLWTSLRVVCPKQDEILLLVSLWVERSYMHHLDLSLYQLHDACAPLDDDRPKHFEFEFSAAQKVWQLFLTIIKRWRSVHVDVCMSFKSLRHKIGAAQLESDWPTSLPLEDIKIAFGPCESGPFGELELQFDNHPIISDESTFSLYLLRNSPRLRAVDWDNRYVPVALDVVQIWPSLLTDVTLYGTQDVMSIFSGLSSCKSLRRLTIYEQTSFSPHLAHHFNHGLSRKLSPIIIPGLETLRLGNFPHPELLFRNLVLPNLHTLIVLRGYNERRGWRGLNRTSWFTLSEMLMRSLLNTLSLEIGGIMLDFVADFDGSHTQWVSEPGRA